MNANQDQKDTDLRGRILILKSSLIGQLRQHSFTLDHLEVIRVGDAIRIIQKQKTWQHADHCGENEFDGFSCCGPECVEELKRDKFFRLLVRSLRDKPDFESYILKAKVHRNLDTVYIEDVQVVELESQT